jgi:hypothetical protein
MIGRLGLLAANAASLIGALTLTACGGSSAIPNVAQQPAPAGAYDFWQRSLMRTPLPGAGCFQAWYPSGVWSRVACSHESRPDNIGGGNHQFTASVAPYRISKAIGSFPLVEGVDWVKNVPKAGGNSSINNYGLQLNSNTFQTAVCGNQSNCKGWEQFIYGNPGPTASRRRPMGRLHIEDWLVGNVTCPKDNGWMQKGNGCVTDSELLNLPNQSIKNLANITLAGTARASGDDVYLSVGSTMYAIQKKQSDGITDLAKHWQSAQFNVFGYGGGSIATFNPGATLIVRLETKSGATSAPSCTLAGSTTAESNNLSYVKTRKTTEAEYPSILYKESNASGGGKASCRAVGGSGN